MQNIDSKSKNVFFIKPFFLKIPKYLVVAVKFGDAIVDFT